ncbi:MAG: TIGR03619 family F420-dependent LLM class oxidoreductase [Acidimicrobiales bacterium]
MVDDLASGDRAVSAPRLLLGLPAGTNEGAGDPQALIAIAELAEATGCDGVVIADHVLIGAHTDRYPWGTFPFPPEAPWLEPLTVLTALAARTRTLELTTGILIVPLRPAALLAKIVATIDRLSGGRLVLGVGTGWQEEELAAHGLDYAQRGALLTDHMAACRALWTDAPATFSSPSVAFDTVWSEPRPIRRGGPRVLFSGTLTPRNVRRIVELGDGWIPIMGSTDDDLREGVSLLRARYETAGRDPGDLELRAPMRLVRCDGTLDIAATVAGAAELIALGATEVSIPAPVLARLPSELGEPLASLAAAWRELLS